MKKPERIVEQDFQDPLSTLVKEIAVRVVVVLV